MKLRFRGVDARGIMVWADFQNGESFYQRKMFRSTFIPTRRSTSRALLPIQSAAEAHDRHAHRRHLLPADAEHPLQVSLLEDVNKAEWLTTAIDDVNEKYGSFTISYGTAQRAKTSSNRRFRSAARSTSNYS
jgi:hypothetical protein